VPAHHGNDKILFYDQTSDNECASSSEEKSMRRNITAYEGIFNRESTLVMTMASSAQLDLLRVWHSARTRRQVVVLAFDVETAKECCEVGIPYLFDENSRLGEGKDMLFKSDEFLKIGLAKFSALKSIIEAGYSVLFSEIDVCELRDPEHCEMTTTTSQSHHKGQKQRGCIYATAEFDLEIQPNILPGELSVPGSEINIGFFYLRSSVAAISLLDAVRECLTKNCGWDQEVFSSIAWKKQCCYVDDNDADDKAHDESTFACDKAEATEECLQMRILSVNYFPTGGNGGLRRRKFRQFGVVPPEYYAKTKTCPVLVHCTGRSGQQSKLNCMENVQRLYGNCSSDNA